MNKIDSKTLKEVCKVGSGETTCRFVTVGSKGFECAKHTSVASIINARIAAGTFNAKGDNCEGKGNEDPASTVVGINYGNKSEEEQ